ncbi:polysaccharide pyruvyl transferase family protein [Clostridiales bacterium]|nr:polysaccharide pyruvyl transferase family protein [Clostridiales bacterium]
MNKVGLLTIHDTLNFGSLFQTYGLYKAIEELGYDITLIDYKNTAITEREKTYRLNEVHTVKELYKAFFHHHFLEAKHINFWGFINDNMKVSEPYYSSSIKKANDLFDTFVVGSDIVWGMEITGYDLNYMLEFAEESKKKVSFSSSVGTRWPKEYDERVKKLLSRFDSICVREQLAQKWINELLPGKQVIETCDPTMLWNKETLWGQFNNTELVPQKKYILIYLKTDDNRTVMDAIAYGKKHGLPVYNINYFHSIPGVKNIRPTNVPQWISWFANAEVIFTASYHGIMFSLYFEKQFFWYSRANSARTESLSKELHIQNREGNKENIEKDIKIDYNVTNKAIESKRELSWSALKAIL